MASKEQVIADYETLSTEDRNVVRASVLPAPPAAQLGAVWIILLVGLFVGAALAGWAAYNFYTAGTPESGAIFLAITTTIVGGLIGLLAPSPVNSGG